MLNSRIQSYNSNQKQTFTAHNDLRRLTTTGDIKLSKIKNPVKHLFTTNNAPKPNPILKWLKGVKISLKETIKEFK